jgi:mevalonate kinase
MKTQGQGSAHAKIILIGEHAVVYGHPGIAIPFKPLLVTCTATSSAEDSLDAPFFKGPLYSIPESLGFILVLVEDLKQTLSLSSLHLFIENTIPESAGLGSSAAISNAIVRAIYDLADQPLSEKVLFEKTQIAEKVMHGSPSGIDALVTASETPYYFVKGQDPTILPISLPGFLVVANSKVKGLTKLAVKNIASLYLKNMAQGHLESIGLMSLLTKEAIEKKEIDDVARLMNQAHYHLQELMVSESTVDKMVDLALREGAIGAKLTGGGLGGCMIALCDNEAIANKVMEALRPIAQDHVWKMGLS